MGADSLREWRTTAFRNHFVGGLTDQLRAREALCMFLMFLCRREPSLRKHGERDKCYRWAGEILEDKRNWGKTREPTKTVAQVISARFDVVVKEFIEDLHQVEDQVRLLFDESYYSSQQLSQRSSLMSFEEIRRRRIFETISSTYLSVPTNRKRYLYIRRAKSNRFAYGILEFHPSKAEGTQGYFFTLVNSSSNPDGNQKRDVYVYVGDVMSSTDIIVGIASLSSMKIQQNSQIDYLVGGYSEGVGSIYHKIEAIRTFNMKVVKGMCLYGVAFIRDGDFQTAVSPFVGVPIDHMDRGDPISFDDLVSEHPKISVIEKVNSVSNDFDRSVVIETLNLFFKQKRIII